MRRKIERNCWDDCGLFVDCAVIELVFPFLYPS